MELFPRTSPAFNKAVGYVVAFVCIMALIGVVRTTVSIAHFLANHLALK